MAPSPELCPGNPQEKKPVRSQRIQQMSREKDLKSGVGQVHVVPKAAPTRELADETVLGQGIIQPRQRTSLWGPAGRAQPGRWGSWDQRGESELRLGPFLPEKAPR